MHMQDLIRGGWCNASAEGSNLQCVLCILWCYTDKHALAPCHQPDSALLSGMWETRAIWGHTHTNTHTDTNSIFLMCEVLMQLKDLPQSIVWKCRSIKSIDIFSKVIYSDVSTWMHFDLVKVTMVELTACTDVTDQLATSQLISLRV